MKQVLLNKGKAVLSDIPVPQVLPGTVLVKVDYSCISTGTEMSGMRGTGTPLWKRALKQPQNVKKALEMLSREGLARTRSFIETKVSDAQPTGYSAAGTVLEVGEGVLDLEPGDRVACAGAQCAHHAELIRVPRNLVVPCPPGLGLDLASTVTLGAIAMQGVRRAEPTLGETVVVVGLGVIGQLAAQLLKANGCRVIGVDLNRDRIQLARELGLDYGLHPDDGPDVEQVARLSDGVGADAVLIAASSPSDAVISSAFQMCRRKGRVVLVGEVGLNLARRDFYYKEIDLRISTSYGPGRYDQTYEEDGHDYPIAYVRWTENRNMSEFLHLMADGRVRVAPLIAKTFALEEAVEAYASLEGGGTLRPMVLLRYPSHDAPHAPDCTVANPKARASDGGSLRIAVAGAGSFVKSMHLPNIASLGDRFHLSAVMSRSGPNAATTASRFGADYATTDYSRVLEDARTEAVLIGSRHDLHASMALAALKAGKHVLLEKPTALAPDEMAALSRHIAQAGDSCPILLTGYNRRFSPHMRLLRELTRERSNPMMLDYRMNAGYLPPDHWTRTAQGGGRNLGEACHIYDAFIFLVDSAVKDVRVTALKPRGGYYSRHDNFVATVRFEEGSVATLTYTSLGAKDHPKESLEVFSDGKVFSLLDYKRLTVAGARRQGLVTRHVEKGHLEELAAFADAVRRGGEWPIPWSQQEQAAALAFKVEEGLRNPA